MKRVIKSYETPEVQVQLSNIKIDVKKKHFSLTLGQKTKRQRNFRTEEIEGTITNELYRWLTKLKQEKIPVKEGEETKWIPTGKMLTSFQKFLAKQEIEFHPGILSEMVFESDNTSKEYVENPFRLVMLENRNVLTLVNVPSKTKKEYVDPSTGEVTTYYSVKKGQIDGRTVNAFIRPEKYRRLIVQTVKEVEVAEVPQQA